MGKDIFESCEGCAFRGDIDWCNKCGVMGFNGWNNTPDKREVIEREHVYVPCRDEDGRNYNTYT